MTDRGTPRGCVECWKRATARTRIYTRNRKLVDNGARWGPWEPVTTVGLYREYHAAHVAREVNSTDQ